MESEFFALLGKGNRIFPPFLHPNPLRIINQVDHSIKGFRSTTEHLPEFFHFQFVLSTETAQHTSLKQRQTREDKSSQESKMSHQSVLEVFSDCKPQDQQILIFLIMERGWFLKEHLEIL